MSIPRCIWVKVPEIGEGGTCSGWWGPGERVYAGGWVVPPRQPLSGTDLRRSPGQHPGAAPFTVASLPLTSLPKRRGPTAPPKPSTPAHGPGARLASGGTSPSPGWCRLCNCRPTDDAYSRTFVGMRRLWRNCRVYIMISVTSQAWSQDFRGNRMGTRHPAKYLLVSLDLGGYASGGGRSTTARALGLGADKGRAIVAGL